MGAHDADGAVLLVDSRDVSTALWVIVVGQEVLGAEDAGRALVYEWGGHVRKDRIGMSASEGAFSYFLCLVVSMYMLFFR